MPCSIASEGASRTEPLGREAGHGGVATGREERRRGRGGEGDGGREREREKERKREKEKDRDKRSSTPLWGAQGGTVQRENWVVVDAVTVVRMGSCPFWD